ncbi:MAG: PP2C family protein-serine/threonine phosphatase, partial [Planctomycetota bacterium]
GGNGAAEVSVLLAGVRGEVYAQPYREHERGGDVHYLSVCGKTMLTKIIVADVAGHGADAALVSRLIHGGLRDHLDELDNSRLLLGLNRAARTAGEETFRFTTMVSATLNSRDHELVYAYAGHPVILHGDAETGRFRPIRPDDGERGGLPLGVLAGTDYVQHRRRLRPKDVLLFYTDALIEVRDPSGEVLGEDGLARLCEEAPDPRPAALKAHLLARLRARAGGGGFEDDLTLVLLEVL